MNIRSLNRARRDGGAIIRRDGGADHRSAVRAPDLTPRHRSRRPQSPVPAARARLRRVSGRRQRARPAARAAAEGLRHRHVGASAPGQEALSQLLDHRPPVPTRPRQVRVEDDRSGDVPAAGRAGELPPEIGRGRDRRVSPRRATPLPPVDEGDAPRRDAERSRSFTATTPTARPRRTRSGATSPSTRSSTTSRRSRSSTTSAASRISTRG